MVFLGDMIYFCHEDLGHYNLFQDFFPLLIYSTILKIIFLGHCINLMLSLLANLLNIISLSISSILGLPSSFFDKSNTSFNLFGLMCNDSSPLINLSQPRPQRIFSL